MRLTWSINTSNPENCHSPPVLSPCREKDKAHCPASIGLFLVAFDRMQLIEVCQIADWQTKRKGGVKCEKSNAGRKRYDTYLLPLHRKERETYIPEKVKVLHVLGKWQQIMPLPPLGDVAGIPVYNVGKSHIVNPNGVITHPPIRF